MCGEKKKPSQCTSTLNVIIQIYVSLNLTVYNYLMYYIIFQEWLWATFVEPRSRVTAATSIRANDNNEAWSTLFALSLSSCWGSSVRPDWAQQMSAAVPQELQYWSPSSQSHKTLTPQRCSESLMHLSLQAKRTKTCPLTPRPRQITLYKTKAPWSLS